MKAEKKKQGEKDEGQTNILITRKEFLEKTCSIGFVLGVSA